jgi:hypothetical protein
VFVRNDVKGVSRADMYRCWLRSVYLNWANIVLTARLLRPSWYDSQSPEKKYSHAP